MPKRSGVLKPGGRFAVSDVVVKDGDVPEEVRRSMELWVGCVAGALCGAAILPGQIATCRVRTSGSAARAESTVQRTPDNSSMKRGSRTTRCSPRLTERFMSAFIRAGNQYGTAGVLWANLLLLSRGPRHPRSAAGIVRFCGESRDKAAEERGLRSCGGPGTHLATHTRAFLSRQVGARTLDALAISLLARRREGVTPAHRAPATNCCGEERHASRCS